MKKNATSKKFLLYFFSLIVATSILIFVIIATNFLLSQDPPSRNILNTSTEFTISDIKNKLPKAYVVQSGSMKPAIKVGSIVITYPSEIYTNGDVVTFSKTQVSKNLITHRIGARFFPKGIENDPVYLTGGDANEEFDKELIPQNQIIGKVVLTLPYLGYVANFAKGPTGFILFVIVPATIVIYEELKALSKEFLRALKRFGLRIRFQNRFVPALMGNENPSSNKNRDFPKKAVLIPILGTLIFFVGLSAGYFFDMEKSLGNILGAAQTFDENGNGGTDSGGPPQVDDNPSCQDLGYNFGFKIEPPGDGVYTLTNEDGELTGSAPEDPDNSITISNFDTTFFDWVATFGIDTVIVKGGNSANTYTYDPESFSDTVLHASENPNNPNNKFFGVSHIEFCYDYDV